MPEFLYSTLDDQDDVIDGMFQGHLDVKGSAGSATSRNSRQPDGGPGIILFPALVDLLDGVSELLQRGRGTFKCSGLGLSLKFRLRDGRMTISHRWTVIDDSSSQSTAAAIWTAAQQLTDSVLGRVTEPTRYVERAEDGTDRYIDFRIQVKESLARFEESRAHLSR
ncbi:MAG: hypothetical protein JF597_39625 [Streptomyces sp.]|uniref:hypothetical protein n=1 Tax=Streptomyces sp. TaxID=1931 RepID=UPI0025E6B29D|nr:hypothetical protein [Streptomyces sp.]MBW8799472.1 hypothetical protein [Streptomyces sp.]